MTAKRLTNLECSCCGGGAGRFQQHYNRDTGYGVCRRCIDWMIDRKMPADELLRNYGTEGVNYEAKPKSPETVGYAIEGEDHALLMKISTRLYDGAILSFDERRTLAFQLSNIFNNAIPIKE